MSSTFTCAHCGDTFERDWDEADAIAEAALLHGVPDASKDPDMVQVCEPCLIKISDAQPSLKTLGSELPNEIARVRDVVIPAYESPLLGGAGAFALSQMRPALAEAERALAAGDVVAMLRVYPKLKGFET